MRPARSRSRRFTAGGFAALLLALSPPASAEPQSYSPHAGQEHPREVYWGDLHVHSSWSTDAGSSGNVRLTPDDAFRFARGDEITAHNGQRIALRRPLDFLLVSDHSEYLGLYPMLEEGHPELLATEAGRRWHQMLSDGQRARIGGEFASGLSAGEERIGTRIFEGMWPRVIANAERYNAPGRFTAFIGYEWTSMPAGANLHRNVLFRDGADRAGQVVPFSSIHSDRPEDLWAYLADYELRTAGQVVAIPHNSNLSAGRMFELVDSDGRPHSKEYAQLRSRWEPVVEATQIKGDSEAAPFLSPDDEYADYGTWDGARGMGGGVHEDWMYAGEYVRPALGSGLSVARAVGANPFQFGLIGSTDAHTSLATADDDDFWGKFSRNEPQPGRAAGPWAALDMPEGSETARQLAARPLAAQMYTWALVASGYAGVWARENTREALFDAIRNRETYATTGPRMVVRFFGGWDFDPDDALAPDLAAVGYSQGTAMGGELGSRPAQASPSFLVSALRDPEGANLDRVQIVKQSLDDDGQVRERIFDVAVSDGRAIDADGRCRTDVGSSVDVASATYTNAIGDAALTTVWRDPDFDPKHRAVYYLRVIEIPTPRWTTYDAARFGEKLSKRADPITRERAYTSPIWYTPEP